MKSIASFLWHLGRFNTEWKENQNILGRSWYCFHECMWEIKQGYGLIHPVKKWIKNIRA